MLSDSGFCESILSGFLFYVIDRKQCTYLIHIYTKYQWFFIDIFIFYHETLVFESYLLYVSSYTLKKSVVKLLKSLDSSKNIFKIQI